MILWQEGNHLWLGYPRIISIEMGWNAVYTNLPLLKTEVYYTDNINLQNHNIGLPSTIPMRVATLIPGVIGAGGQYRVGSSCISVLFFYNEHWHLWLLWHVTVSLDNPHLDTIIALKKLEGLNCRLESAVSYECLTMIPARALVLRILAQPIMGGFVRVNWTLNSDILSTESVLQVGLQ